MASKKTLRLRMEEAVGPLLGAREGILGSAYCHTWPGWGSTVLFGAIFNRMRGAMQPHFVIATNIRLILIPTWRERPDPNKEIRSWAVSQLRVESSRLALTGRRLDLQTPTQRLRLNFDFGWGRECKDLVNAISDKN